MTPVTLARGAVLAGATPHVFDGFPYLTTRIVGALYHMTLLPTALSDTDLIAVARTQVLANRLDACLALAHDRAVYIDPDGHGIHSATPALGGHLVTGKLALAVACDDAVGELRTRQARLDAMIERMRRRGGFLLGDPSKRGRAATDEERQRLDGCVPDGTPRGLTRCLACDQWTGVCLDPSPRFAGRVTTVHCACDNHNRCARCLAPLFEWRLNANYYEPRDRSIWHVPGFCGLNHRCTEQRSVIQ